MNDNQSVDIRDLPDDMVDIIVRGYDPMSLIQLSHTSQQFRNIVTDEYWVLLIVLKIIISSVPVSPGYPRLFFMCEETVERVSEVIEMLDQPVEKFFVASYVFYGSESPPRWIKGETVRDVIKAAVGLGVYYKIKDQGMRLFRNLLRDANVTRLYHLLTPFPKVTNDNLDLYLEPPGVKVM